MKQVKLSDDSTLPSLGLGTWRMGESARNRAAEVTAVRAAIAMGYRLIDTAEMYGDGGAESVVGEAVAQALRSGDVTRGELCIVSKVYPHNASRAGTLAACERSVQRLGVDRIDLYLLHWRGQHPLRDTVAAMQELIDHGHIARWGVSNFDTDDMAELAGIEAELGGPRCATNQVYYSLSERGPEFSLLPWMRERGMPLMAYSPIDQGALSRAPVLRAIGERHGVSAAQVALAWVMRQLGVMAIPKAVREVHLRENLAAAEIELSTADRAELDRQFRPPQRKAPLAMI